MNFLYISISIVNLRNNIEMSQHRFWEQIDVLIAGGCDSVAEE